MKAVQPRIGQPPLPRPFCLTEGQSRICFPSNDDSQRPQSVLAKNVVGVEDASAHMQPEPTTQLLDVTPRGPWRAVSFTPTPASSLNLGRTAGYLIYRQSPPGAVEHTQHTVQSRDHHTVFQVAARCSRQCGVWRSRSLLRLGGCVIGLERENGGCDSSNASSRSRDPWPTSTNRISELFFQTWV